MNYQLSIINYQLKTLLFSLLLLLCLSPPAEAAVSDLAGSWTAQEVISNNAVLDLESISAFLGLEPSELMSLQLSTYGYGKMLFSGVVYPVELRALGKGVYALIDSDTNFLLSLADDGALVCTLQDSLSLSLTPTGNDIPFETEHPVSDALSEAAAKQALAADLCSSAVQLSLPFSEQQTQSMSNFMFHGRYWLDSSTLYGMAFDKNSPLPNLVCSEILLTDTDLQLDTYKVLDRHVNAVFLTPVENWLYYIRHDRDTGISSLARLDRSTLKVEELLTASDLSYLQFHNNRLYFTAGNHHFFSSDLCGKDLQPVLEKEIYYPYFLDDDHLLYQDNADSESFHLFRCSDGIDLKLTNTPSFYPILSGSSLYFLSAEDDLLHLSRLDLSSPSPDSDFPFPIETSPFPFSDEFAIVNDRIFSRSQSEVALGSWAQLSESPGNAPSRRLFYISESFFVSAEMDDYGGQNVRALYLIDSLSGHEGVFPHVY